MKPKKKTTVIIESDRFELKYFIFFPVSNASNSLTFNMSGKFLAQCIVLYMLPFSYFEQEISKNEKAAASRPIVSMYLCYLAILNIKGASITGNLFHHLVREHTQVTYLDDI